MLLFSSKSKIGVEFGGRLCNSKSRFERTQLHFGKLHKIISSHQMPLISALLSGLSEIGVRTTFVVLTITASLLFDELGERVKNLADMAPQPSRDDENKTLHQITEMKAHYDLIFQLTD